MRLVVILTLSFGVCAPMIDAERVVFVVPRYVRRSYSGNASPFYSHVEGGYKMGHSMRPGTKRPHFTGHYSGSSPDNKEQFFQGEKYREDSNQPQFPVPDHAVNHVVIPHGKGISHGVSFGKGYPSHDSKAMNENFDFHSEDGSNLEFNEQNRHQDVKFEEERFPGFHEQSQAPANQDWSFGQSESVHNQEQQQASFEAPDGFGGREESAALKTPIPEQPRADLSPGIPPPAEPQTMKTQESIRAPIILQDTIDMREYVEKVKAFAKSWPAAAAAAVGLDNFQWKNTPGIQTTPNFYQGYNSWTSSLSTMPRPGGYQVQEESQEGPHRRSFRTTMT